MLNLARWRRVPSTSFLRLRARGFATKFRPRSVGGFSKIAADSTNQPNPQHAFQWSKTLVKPAAEWASGWRTWYATSLSHKLAVWGVVVFTSGATAVYLFALERVPITGRRRFSWVSRSTLAHSEQTEREFLETLEGDNKCLSVISDYPGLQKMQAVLDRLVRSSGIDDVKWEVRVLDKPSKFPFPMNY